VNHVNHVNHRNVLTAAPYGGGGNEAYGFRARVYGRDATIHEKHLVGTTEANAHLIHEDGPEPEVTTETIWTGVRVDGKDDGGGAGETVQVTSARRSEDRLTSSSRRSRRGGKGELVRDSRRDESLVSGAGRVFRGSPVTPSGPEYGTGA
jgi:hypothetical protein